MKSINKLIAELDSKQPKYILGLGQYNNKDKHNLRIETQCTNKYRNRILGSELEIISMNPFLNETNILKFSKGIGNSYCNLVSYQISKLNHLYTFIHIPKGFNIKLTAKELNIALRNIQ